ncbi:MAG TPA: SH3 domain-containing protein [Pyrinomonadaceae bacterium]|nr:SH3 domain-containing protein [Pyrinomonadaceae bacterium]
MRRTLSIIFFIFGLATLTFAQSDEFAPLPTIKVEKKVNLRRGPATTRSRLRMLPPATELRIVDQNPSNGFYRVIFGKGRLGWVWSKNISVPTPAAAMPTTSAPTPPCANSFTDCQPEGCGVPGSTQALLNTVKRRLPTETTTRTLTFADIRGLQQKANDLVGQHNELTQPERDSLTNLNFSGGTVREGRLVKVRGFLAAGLEPHANSGGESVNCRLTQNANNDFHISVVENAGEDEFKGIVVEMIPQGRDPAWTLTKLKAVRQQGKRILVIGALFYDNIHLVNDDPSHPIGGQPKRVSLWEVHPITKFFVCIKATNNCSVSSTGATSGWQRLEDF